MEELKALLAGHHLVQRDGLYKCDCGEEYGKIYRNPEQRPRMIARHDHHLARILYAAGATVAGGDPRDALRARMAAGEH